VAAVYDAWFAQGPTNASLAGPALYSRKVLQFKALLAEEGATCCVSITG
jgi:predicted aminopeptidase